MTLPWYPRDMGKYARDTRHLSMLEHGAYNLLLDCYYSTGGLPGAKQCSSNASGNAELMPDHSRIYRVCSAMSKAEQDAVDAVLEMFFDLKKNGQYRHTKADEIIQIQVEKHEKRVAAGRKGGSKQSSKQCSSKAPQKEIKTKTKKESISGDVLNKSVDKKEGATYNVEHVLNDKAMAAAKRNAPGWDIHHLIARFNDGVNGGSMKAPNNANLAFPNWCKAVTKGQEPA